LAEIAGDAGSREWKSRPAGGRGKLKAPWLADAVAKLDKKRAEEKSARKNGSSEKRTGKKSSAKKKLKT
jgi:hypothetical protein